MGDKPVCFVLMPFGKKPDPAGGAEIDFNRIYQAAIKRGVEDAGMQPIRADEEELGGIIHLPMYERLLLCDFAVADLTTSNANVLYELGIRHAARPRTTLTVYAAQKPLPFDVAPLRAQPYKLGKRNSFSNTNAKLLRQAVCTHLRQLRKLAGKESTKDSPLFQLLPDWKPGELPLKAATSFQAQIKTSEQVKQQLSKIRARSNDDDFKEQNAAALTAVRKKVLRSKTADAGVLTSLMLSYRALGDWTGMIKVYGKLPELLQKQVELRQQLALAYNRRAEEDHDPADREQATQILQQLQEEQGPTPETSGLIGRVHKGQWDQARKGGQPDKAKVYLADAIAAYVAGFEADWRDGYPGINAVTLLDVEGGETSLAQKQRLLPVVRFAVEQRLRGRAPGYWDHATLLEIAIHENDAGRARAALGSALAAPAESWWPRSTADNLRIIRQARQERGEDVAWLSEIIQELDPEAKEPAPAAR